MENAGTRNFQIRSIRFPRDEHGELSELDNLADKLDLPFSEICRRAIRLGLPTLRRAELPGARGRAE